jgi:ribosomal protein S18 acetylase RimI-like enzyme
MQNQITIKNGEASDIPVIMDLAEKTWWPVYSPILKKEQIRYMLDTIYSETTLQRAIESEEQKFLLLFEKQSPRGFAAFGIREEDPNIHKLHKLYVLTEDHGKGYGKKLIQEVVDRIKAKDMHVLDLNVNRFNPARSFYEKLGFRIIGEEDLPIGEFWMNDFVMRLEF